MSKILLLCFVLLPLTAFSDASVGGYSINESVTQRGDFIEVGGRINSGPKCEDLEISSTAISDQGQTVIVFTSTSYSGWGSSLYDEKKKIQLNRSKGFPSWRIAQTFANCRD